VKKERIDKLLVKLRLAESIAKAQALIMAGVVLANDQRIEKPSEEFAPDTNIRLKGESASSRYVGRGGLKLERALSDFGLDVSDFVCLDVGASTGGFTDCLLQHGARKVYAADVGHNQIDWKLRQDRRVEVRENVNARYLTTADFGESFDLIVMDVSFISVTKIFPAIVPLLNETGKIIVLVKPQFEVRRGEVGEGGIVREPEKHERVISEVNFAAQQNNLALCSVIDSPILGAEGNKEFLAFYERNKNQ
jgi:23S rRNA (cytidine1920-2'-O)/16S rRNA (cytidine1409-2'-O)-methyltransferase